MPVIPVIVIAFIGLVLTFVLVWAWQLKTRNAGMVDPVWAGSLGAVALLCGALGTGPVVNRVLVACGGLLWGARLCVHLWRRNYGQPEDARYHQLREQWGVTVNRKMFWFFQFQVLISMLLSAAFFVPVYRTTTPASAWLVIAVLLWLVSVVGEALADRQLHGFKADPANHDKVCQAGLWRYSRHPNYFFECVHWVAYIALSIGTPWGWLTLLPPVLMGVLLMKVSGIPMVEQRSAQTRPGYADYMRTTSALIPWPPRRNAS
jgi:steroid 5-alpha reductase family enzyme